MGDLAAVVGRVDVLLLGPDGAVRHRCVVRNLVTDAGDAYYVAKAAAGIAPASASAPSPATGMKAGSATTAAAKSGAGAALGTYLTGSNKTFDATYPQVLNLGGGLGVSLVYRCTWAPGELTATIGEFVIVTDAAANATSAAGATISRTALATPLAKGADDTLVVTWQHKFLGV